MKEVRRSTGECGEVRGIIGEHGGLRRKYEEILGSTREYGKYGSLAFSPLVKANLIIIKIDRG
jgi:hypothetical protein